MTKGNWWGPLIINGLARLAEAWIDGIHAQKVQRLKASQQQSEAESDKRLNALRGDNDTLRGRLAAADAENDALRADNTRLQDRLNASEAENQRWQKSWLPGRLVTFVRSLSRPMRN